MKQKLKNIILGSLCAIGLTCAGVGLGVASEKEAVTASAATTPKYAVMFNYTESYVYGSGGGTNPTTTTGTATSANVKSGENTTTNISVAMYGSSYLGSGGTFVSGSAIASDSVTIEMTSGLPTNSITVTNASGTTVGSSTSKSLSLSGLAEGRYNVALKFGSRAWTINARAGASVTVTGSYSFIADAKAPTISGASTSKTGKYANTAFTVSASDAGSGVASFFYKRPNDSSFSIVSGTSITIPAGSTNGLYSFYAADYAGNTTATYYVNYDNVGPSGYFILSNGSTVGNGGYTTKYFTFVPEDSGSGIGIVGYRGPNDTTLNFYSPDQEVGGTQGIYYFEPYDMAGNKSAFFIMYDTVKPTVKIYGGSTELSDGGHSTAGKLKFTASDAMSGVKTCYVKKPGTSSYVTVTNNTEFTACGTYSYYVVDNAGNQSSTYTATLEHSYTANVISPTCTGGGYTNHTCSNCGASYTDTVTSALGHSFSGWTTTKAATCTADGTKQRTCTRCGKVETETIGKLGHAYSNDVVSPTCTSGGYTSHTCSRCGSSYTDNATSALGHSYAVWTTTKAATCTADGSKKRVCTRCGNTETSTITKLGHSYTDVVVNSTCTSGGYTSHTCSRCNLTYTDNATAALGHSYSAWSMTKSATCTADGSRKRTCTRCSNVETETVAKLGHDYKVNTTSATCTTAGKTSYTCSRCNDSYDSGSMEALGHNYDEWVIMKEVTCTVDGSKQRVCLRCRNKETQTITKTGHNYKGVTTDANCTTAGKTVYTCDRCSGSYTVAGSPALGHDYKDTVVKATCTSGGSTTHTCNRCGNSYTDGIVAALGHNFSDWNITKEATCTANGLSVRSCSRCQTSESQTLVKLGHDYKETVTPAACINGGVSSFVCYRCNDSYEGNYKPALGHDYKVEVVAATCIEDGYTKHTCSRCNDSYNDSIISANGHNFTMVKVDATCETNGFDGEKCENCGIEIQNNIVPAFGHSYASTVITSADCTHYGLRRFVCDRCADTYEKVIQAVGHTYEIANEAHQDGNVIRLYECKECADSYEQVLEEQYDMVSNYMITIFDEYSPYMVWVFLATAAIWSVAMGVSIIIAHKNEDKVKAKKMLINYGIGMVAIFVILIAAPLLIYGIASIVG